MEMYLICNATDCSAQLTEMAYVTTCYHIFCPEHGVSLAGPSNHFSRCLNCLQDLHGDADVVQVNLNPDENTKNVRSRVKLKKLVCNCLKIIIILIIVSDGRFSPGINYGSMFKSFNILVFSNETTN